MTKTIKTKIDSTGFKWKPIVKILAVIGIAITIYIAYRASISQQKIFTGSLLALFAGILFESFRITDNWKNVVYRFIGAYLFSLISFIFGKDEGIYDFERHITFWPYCFVFCFCLATVIFNMNKVTAKLTEGITLLQSLSIIYWTIDYGFVNIDSTFTKFLFVIALLFSAFSIVHALTYFKLSREVRLTLSVWSTIIMMALAIDNIYRVSQSQSIETTQYLSQGLYIGLQYFLLGVSAIYITRDYMLLAGFIPIKNKNYEQQLKETIQDHINRYSENQVSVRDSILCIFYALIVYGMNYKYQMLPRHTMIWLVFLTLPFILQLISKLKKPHIS